MQFTFDTSDWDQTLDTLQAGDKLPALRCLELLEAMSQQEAEEALLALEERGVTLDISDLPKMPGGGEAAERLNLEQKWVQAGNLLENLEENDPLRLYLEELSQMPTEGDAQNLAAQYAAGDEAASQQLVNLSLPLVVERACRMTGYGVLLMDLIQEGSLGLWQGVLCYTTGDFTDHVCQWIDHFLYKAVVLQAHTGEIGQKIRQGMEDYRDADQQLLSQLGRNPTLEEIAEAIHITVQEASVYASVLSQARAKERIEESRKVKEESPEDAQAVENTAYFQTRQRILELLSTLSEQEAKLLTLRFGLEGGLPQSPQQAGAALGLTEEDVLKLEAEALLKLRQQTQ